MERPSALSQDTKKISSPICLYNHFNAIFLIKKLFKIIYKKKKKKKINLFLSCAFRKCARSHHIKLFIINILLSSCDICFFYICFFCFFVLLSFYETNSLHIHFFSLFVLFLCSETYFLHILFFFLFVLLPYCETYFYYILFFYSFILQISFCNILWLYLINNLYFFDNNFDEYLYSFICKKK